MQNNHCVACGGEFLMKCDHDCINGFVTIGQVEWISGLNEAAAPELLKALIKISKLRHKDRTCSLEAQGYNEQECEEIGMSDYAAQLALEAINIKDYLHLYFGCECEQAIIIPGQELNFVGDPSLNVRHLYNVLNGLSVVKLRLRPLSDMTEEEATELESIGGGTAVFEKGTIVYSFDSHRTLWALKKGFDLFCLIESGLAIDKTTIK